MNDRKTIKYDLAQTITKTIYDFDMVEKKDTILVAVSGGPDSVCLMRFLLALKKRYGIKKMGIAHVNHLLRGEESFRDENFVKVLAKRFDLAFHGEQKDVKTFAKKQGLSIEEAGREVRYHFFDFIAETHGYTKIATGHNRDDNAELVLMNLLRGAGPKGISGIPPIRDGRYIRPLIRISKKQVLMFLKAENQTYVMDVSNKDMAYLRNNIRYDLIPHLQSRYNPKIIDALDRLSHILRQEEDFLEAETHNTYNRCLVKADLSSISFSKSELSTLYPALLNRVFRKAIHQIKKNLKRISLVHINDMVEFCLNPSPGKSLDLPDQIRIYKTTHTIIVKKEKMPLRQIGRKEKQLKQMNKRAQRK